MYILKCECCEFEQVIKKRIDEDAYKQLINSDGLYCDRKICDGRNIKRPKGYIAVHGVFGGWTIFRQASLEEYKRVKRAQELIDLVMKNL